MKTWQSDRLISNGCRHVACRRSAWFRSTAFAVASIGLPLILTACNPENHDTSDRKIGVPLPRALSPDSLPAGTSMVARAVISQLQLGVPLEIGDGKASGRFTGLEPGIYSVQIMFEVQHGDFGTVKVAEVSREVEVKAGDDNTLIVDESDYSYPDADGDRYSNLVEIQQGTNPNLVTDTPRTARVFFTSVAGTGDLGSWSDASGLSGLAAGDAICQARANAGGFSGKFVAWLSDEHDDAYCRIQGLSGKKAENCGQEAPPQLVGPWVRMDGFPFAPEISAMLDEGEVYSPPIYDEFMNNSSPFEESGNVYLWTGTSQRGEVRPDTCNNWTSNSEEVSATQGRGDSAGYSWTRNIKYQCSDSSAHLLCFESKRGAPLPTFEEQGKVVFRTSVRGSGDLSGWPDAEGQAGRAAGDAICRNRAEAGGLPNADSYKAWLSESTTAAINHIVGEGPWVRPDGVLFARTKDVLLSEGSLTSVSVDEFGHYFTEDVSTFDEVSAWTGTDSAGYGTASYCGDWLSPSTEKKGSAANFTFAGLDWAGFEPSRQELGMLEYSCDSQLSLICFED